MNNKKRTFITIVCSILFIMPSFLGVPLADGNLVLVPTPDSGQVNDEISTITDLNDDNIKTIITSELLLQAELDESDLSDSDEIQGHAIRTGNGNNDNNNSSIPTEHSGYVESDQSSQSNVVAETTPIPQGQFPVENASAPTSSWPLIPDYSGFGYGTDSTGLLVDPETSPTGYVNSTIVDASLPDDMNLTAVEDPLSNTPLNAIDTDEGTHTIVEQLDHLNGTLGIVTSNETTLTPIPDLTGSITFTDETTDSELGGDIANGVYDDSLTLIDAGIDSQVDSSLIQGVYETDVENDDENTASTSEITAVEGSDPSSTDPVNIIVSNTNSGSSGDEDYNSSYSSSDEDHDNDGQCSDNSVHDHGHDKHKDKDKHRDGDRGDSEANDDEHHTDSEITHDNISHEDSDHQNGEGSDDDHDHHDHDDEGENNHDDSDHDDHDDDE